VIIVIEVWKYRNKIVF